MTTTRERRVLWLEAAADLTECQRIARMSPDACAAELSEITDRLYALKFIQRLSDTQLEHLARLPDEEVQAAIAGYETEDADA